MCALYHYCLDNLIIDLTDFIIYITWCPEFISTESYIYIMKNLFGIVVKFQSTNFRLSLQFWINVFLLPIFYANKGCWCYSMLETTIVAVLRLQFDLNLIVHIIFSWNVILRFSWNSRKSYFIQYSLCFGDSSDNIYSHLFMIH